MKLNFIELRLIIRCGRYQSELFYKCKQNGDVNTKEVADTISLFKHADIARIAAKPHDVSKHIKSSTETHFACHYLLHDFK